MKMYLCPTSIITDFCMELFVKYGFSYVDSAMIAKQLVVADMRAMPSHGLVRVEMYLTHVKKGAINPAGVPEVVHDTPTAAVIDAHRAAGAVASEFGVKLAREKAEKYGLGMSVVRNSNHHGTCGYWGMKLAKDDMIAFVSSNTPPLLAAPVSKGPVIGNNPISVVVPANNKDMCLDISNGVMAFGKIHEYRRLSKPFPPNAWLDKNGNPTIDPFANDFLEFISLPVGMHKGFGLAVMAEMVTSMLSGGQVAADIIPANGDLETSNPTSHCFLAINIAHFMDPAVYRAKNDSFIQYLHAQPVQKGGDYIYYPGEIENIAYEKSKKEGVCIAENVIDFLIQKAKEVNVPVPSEIVSTVIEQ